MPRDDERMRLDFNVVPLGNDSFIFELDPEHYKLIVDENGKEFYVGEDKIRIPKDELVRQLTKVHSLPVHYSPPKNFDIKEYQELAKTRVKELLDRRDSKFTPSDKTSEYLQTKEGKSLDSLVLYIDIVGSTNISKSLSGKDFAKYVSTFTSEMSRLIDNYRGYILKCPGDCVIGVFPIEFNGPGMTDNLTHCVLHMRSMIEEVLNPLFINKGLPKIDFRIGVDVGKSEVLSLGLEGIKNNLDLLGYTMNVAAKLQSLAPPNGAILGQHVYSTLSQYYKKYCKEIKVKPELKITHLDEKTPYKAYVFCCRWVLN